MMEIEQLFSILKLVCSNDAIRTDTQFTNDYEVVLYQFRHWCYTNKFNYTSIQSDIYSPNPNHSLVLQWFQRNRHIQIYNQLVDIIINQTQKIQQQQLQLQLQQQQQQKHSFQHQPQPQQQQQHMPNTKNIIINHKPPSPASVVHYQSYSSSNDEDTDDPLIQNTEERAHSNFKSYYYNDIYIDTDDNSYNHKFKCLITPTGAEAATVTVKYSLFEFILSLQSLNLSTINAVWQKIPKNEDEVIGDKQNLCLCIHILICIVIQNKYKNKAKATATPKPTNNYNQFQTDPNYLRFLDDITCTLCDSFLTRSVRHKLAPNCLALKDNKSASHIVMGFGDLVENLPKWLLAINDILAQK